MARAPSERTIIFLVGAIQFVNILEFMIVMPMGPDFALALGIPASQLGYIGGSYTAAAAVAGLLGSLFLDRFDRRPALGLAMLGLVLGTAAAGLATGLGSLMAARVVAGLFGGPATSLALSVVADVIPPERRGKAMGAVMGAFSVASVLGVPAGLELSRQGGWRAPFFTIAALGLLISGAAVLLLPPLRGHLSAAGGAPRVSFRSLLANPLVLSSYASAALVMSSAFVLIPNISAYLQFNLGYPRADLGGLYLAGGTVSFFCMRWVGGLVDRLGPARVGTGGALMLALITWAGFVAEPPVIPVLLVFVGFMASAAFRNVPYNTLATRVPRAHERARFLSLQSTVQHLGSAGGAFLSSRLLVERADKSLAGVGTVAWISIALGLLLPGLFRRTQRLIAARDRPPVAP